MSRIPSLFYRKIILALCRVAVVFILLFFIVPQTASADGIIIDRTVTNVPIPDQRALIHFDNGVEKLVIETHFIGNGSEFVWVVPVPSKPKIEKVSPGVLNTLHVLFRPKVVHNVDFSFSTNIFIIVIILVIIEFILPRKILKFLPRSLRCSCAFILLLIAPCAMTIEEPVKIGCGISAESAMGISVLDRKNVGAFETVTISAEGADSLIKWLSTNGFKVPSMFRDALDYYVNKEWVFVTAKLRSEGGNTGTLATHPLMFTFNTETPVYPMRMTAVQDGPCSIDLYVFGPDRAEAEGFRVERCDRVAFSTHRKMQRDGTILVYHKGISEIIGPKIIGTKLSATLKPEDMQDDLDISFVPFKRHRDKFFTKEGGFNKSINVVLGGATLCITLVLLLTLMPLTHSVETIPHKTGRLICFILLFVPLAAVPAYYMTLPVRDIPSKNIYRRDTSLHYHSVLSLKSLEHNNSEEVARKFLRKYFSEKENPILGGPVREEDSPGNYIIRKDEQGNLEYVWYDLNAYEHIEKLNE